MRKADHIPRSAHPRGKRFAALLLGGVLALCATAVGALNPDKGFWNFGIKYVGWDEGFADSVTDVVQDNEGFIWVATHQGLVRFDGHEGQIYDVSEYPGLLSNRLERLYLDRHGTLFILSAKGVSRLNGAGFHVVARRDALAGAPLAIAEGPSGRLWAATAGDLFTLDGDAPAKAPVEADFPRPISSVAGAGGRLWVGGQGAIAMQEDSGWRIFPLPRGFESARVLDFHHYQERLWIATEDGVFSLQGGAVVPELEPATAGQQVNALVADRDGNLWLAGRSLLARRFPDGRVETPDLGLSEFGIEPHIRRVIEDRDGVLWLASMNFSLLKVRDAMGTRISFQQGLKDVAVAALAASPNGRIHLGTENGVYAIDAGRAALQVAGEELPDPRVLTLHFDSAGALWIGTASGLAVHERGHIVTPLQVSELSGTPVLAVLDHEGETWIGTRRGLYRLRADALETFSGVQGVEVRCLTPRPSGGIWIGTNSGLFSYHHGNTRKAGSETPLENAVINAMALLPGERLLAASQDNGLFVQRGEDWRHLSRAQGIPLNGATFVSAADGENLWVAATVGIYRIALTEITPGADGRVDATVLAYSGKMIRGADYVDCCTGAGGSNGVLLDDVLWLPTKDGVYALGVAETPPWNATAPVFIRGVMVGKSPVETRSDETLVLGPEQRDIKIDFSALALTAYVDVRYRYRLQGYDEHWSEAGRTGSAQYTNLKPGEYRFLVQAGLHKDAWGESTGLDITRRPLFVETPWFAALLVALAILTLIALFRLRMWLLRRKHELIEEEIAQRTSELNALNSELSERNLQLLKASHTDPLTGLLNRRFLLPAMEAGDEPLPADLATRLENRSAMLLLDVDDFKSINDRHGHLVGDETLRHLARLLATLTRAGDFVIRWGGEEFLLVCDHAEGDLCQLAERIRTGIAGHRFVLRSGEQISMTCSIGAISCPLWEQSANPVSWKAHLAAADRAMFAVKRHGRDGWVCLSAGSQAPTGEQTDWPETRLKDLVDADIVAWTASRDEIRLGKETARIELN